MKTSLQLKMSQQLTMTPQLQQAIRLLQLSTLDLQQEIQEALETNPMLEVREDDSGNSSDGEHDNSNTSESLNGEMTWQSIRPGMIFIPTHQPVMAYRPAMTTSILKTSMAPPIRSGII